MDKIKGIKEKLKKLELKLNPPLPKEELAFFEKYLKVKLPDEYKQFLTEVGNGGAGPFYGILPLDMWADAVDGPVSDDFELADPYMGTITICDQGCTYYSLLVVTGKDRGKIVNYDMQSREAHFSQYESFSGWYLAWLDKVLKKEKIEWFGYK